MKKKKVAIFCNALMGPTKSGGAGVVQASILEVLIKAGYSVTIYLRPYADLTATDFRKWQDKFARMGARMELIPSYSGWVEMPEQAAISYAVYELLKQRHYDVVHFIEAVGMGYYPMLAKKAGLAFENTVFFVTVVGSYYWHLRENSTPFAPHVLALDNYFLERKSPELADVVCVPTRFTLRWCQDLGWKFPRRTFILPYPLNVSSLPFQGRRDRVDEIVFFGRLETRKGLEAFCDALEKIPTSALKGKVVTFLGQLGFVGNASAGQYIRARSKSWGFRWKLISNYGQRQAVDYLRSRNVIAVIPSRSETFGYTVAECASIGIPFICSPIAPFKEILHPKSHAAALYDGSVTGLAGKLSEILVEGQSERPKLAFDFAEIPAKWENIHASLETIKPRRMIRSGKKLKISVCIVHKDRPLLLDQCLAGFSRQTRQPDEIVIVDNGSAERPKISGTRKKLKFIRLDREVSVSEARNLAARAASGDYIIFFDDDDVPKATQLGAMEKAALLNDADVVTCGFERFTGEAPPNPAIRGPTWIPLGDAIECGLFYNPFGAMSALIRRKPFLRIGGMKTVSKEVGEEDSEFFARALLKGLKLIAMPEALYWYRVHSANRSREINAFESSHHRLSAYLPPEMAPLAHLIASIHLESDSRREEFMKFRESLGLRLAPEHRKSFTKVLFQPKSGDAVGGLLHRQIKMKPSRQTTFELPPLRLKNIRRVMVEIKSFGSHETWIELKCKARVADGSSRWVTSAREIPPSPQSTQLVLDAMEFTANPRISVSGSGWRVFRSITILGEAGM